MSRIRTVLSNQVVGTTAWASSSIAVSAVTGIFTARSLGPGDRGTLALVVSIAGFCVLVSALGTNVAIRRHLPRRELVNRAGYHRATALLFVPLVIVLIAVTYTVATLVDPDFGRWTVGVAFIGYGIAYYFSNQWLDLLNALGLVRASAMVNALGTYICLGLVAPIAMTAPSLELIVWAYTASVTLQVLISIAIVAREPDSGSRGPRGVGRLFRDGSRLLGLNVGQHLAYQGDTVLLGVLSNRVEVGNYAVAITPAAIFRIPSAALGQVLFHEVAKGRASSRFVLTRIVLLVSILLPAAVIAWVMAGWLIDLLYGQAYETAVDPFRVLLIAEFALSPFQVIGRALAGAGSTWGPSASGLIGAVVLFPACIILIPAFGALGAAWASVLAYASMSGLSIVLYLRSGRGADVKSASSGETAP